MIKRGRVGLGLGLTVLIIGLGLWQWRAGSANNQPGTNFRQGNSQIFSYIYDTLKSKVQAEALKSTSQRLGVKEEQLAAVVSGQDYGSLAAGGDLETFNRRLDTLNQVQQYFDSLQQALLEAQVTAMLYEQSANNEVSDAPSDWLVELNQLADTLFKGKRSMQARLEGSLKALAIMTKKGFLMNKQSTMIDDPNKCKLAIGRFKGPLNLGFASTRMPETPPLAEFHQEFESQFRFSALYDLVTKGVAARLGEIALNSANAGNKAAPNYALEKQVRLSDQGQNPSVLSQAAAVEQEQIAEALMRARYQLEREVQTLTIKAAKDRVGLELENFLGSAKRMAEMTAQMQQVATQRFQSISQC